MTTAAVEALQEAQRAANLRLQDVHRKFDDQIKRGQEAQAAVDSAQSEMDDLTDAIAVLQGAKPVASVTQMVREALSEDSDDQPVNRPASDYAEEADVQVGGIGFHRRAIG